VFITKRQTTQVLTKVSKGSNAQLLSGLRTANRGSIWEQKLHEVFREDVGGRSGERVHAVHLQFVVDADGDDIARRDRLEIDPVMQRHHAKGFMDSQVECAAVDS
jgi:hypothetical protein